MSNRYLVLDPAAIQKFFKDKSNRNDYVLLFPGKFEFKNDGLYTVKPFENIKELGEQGVATLNLPTNGNGTFQEKYTAVQNALADFWKAIGYGKNFVMPVFKNVFPWDNEQVKIGAANLDIADLYHLELTKIKAYLEAANADQKMQIEAVLDQQFKDALEFGRAKRAPQITSEGLEEQQWFTKQGKAGIHPKTGDIKTPSKTKDFSFNEDTWEVLETELHYQVDRKNKIATFVSADKTIEINVDAVNGIKSKIALTEEGAKKMWETAFKIYQDKATLTIEGKDQKEYDLLRKAYEEIKSQNPNKSFTANFVNLEEKQESKKAKVQTAPEENQENTPKNQEPPIIVR